MRACPPPLPWCQQWRRRISWRRPLTPSLPTCWRPSGCALGQLVWALVMFPFPLSSLSLPCGWHFEDQQAAFSLPPLSPLLPPAQIWPSPAPAQHCRRRQKARKATLPTAAVSPMAAQHWALRCQTLSRCNAREVGKQERASLSIFVLVDLQNIILPDCFTCNPQGTLWWDQGQRWRRSDLQPPIHIPQPDLQDLFQLNFLGLLLMTEEQRLTPDSRNLVALFSSLIASSHLPALTWKENKKLWAGIKFSPTRSAPRFCAVIAREADFFAGFCTASHVNLWSLWICSMRSAIPAKSWS